MCRIMQFVSFSVFPLSDLQNREVLCPLFVLLLGLAACFPTQGGWGTFSPAMETGNSLCFLFVVASNPPKMSRVSKILRPAIRPALVMCVCLSVDRRAPRRKLDF
jgi:hypothetical protein